MMRVSPSLSDCRSLIEMMQFTPLKCRFTFSSMNVEDVRREFSSLQTTDLRDASARYTYNLFAELFGMRKIVLVEVSDGTNRAERLILEETLKKRSSSFRDDSYTFSETPSVLQKPFLDFLETGCLSEPKKPLFDYLLSIGFSIDDINIVDALDLYEIGVLSEEEIRALFIKRGFHVVEITKNPRLELHLQGTASLTEDSFVAIRDIYQIKKLTLSRLAVRDNDLKSISTLLGLTVIHLSYCRITDSELSHLANLKELQEIDLSGTSISEIGIRHLHSLEKLQKICLDSCSEITDQAVFFLSTFIQLQTVSLSNCKKITDSSLYHLSTLSALEYIFLNSCDQITTAGVNQLFSSLPYLKRVYVLLCPNVVLSPTSILIQS